MLTNPNTLGLFDANIEEIAQHRPRRRRDALLRRREPQRGHGHRRGPATWASTSCTSTCTRRSRSRTAAAGPGAGPIAVSRPHRAVPAAPAGRAHEATTATARRFDLDYDRPKSIGRLRGFQGNYGVFVRSYAYILLARRATGCGRRRRSRCSTPTTCWRGCSEGRGRVPARGLRPPLHARVRALRRADEAASWASGRSTSPSACSTTASTRRPSTSRCSSTRRCWSSRPRRRPRRRSTRSPTRSPRSCARRAEDPEIARNAPYTTPVRRLDEAGAAKHPVIRQPLERGWQPDGGAADSRAHGQRSSLQAAARDPAR